MTDFFEFRRKITKKEKGTAPPPTAAQAKDRAAKALTVSDLTRKIDGAIQSQLPETILVRGEVSNYSLHGGSGHAYFTLKDASACIDCVMWRSDVERMKFKPSDGMELLASGHVGIYAQRGRYQIYVRSLSPLGQGSLELAFQQMRKKLAAEGLFEPERKKLLPAYPVRIAIVTGAQAAALHDMLKVLRRYPWLKLFVYSVPVQGEGSAAKIAAALWHLSKRQKDVGGIDVILLARGGGSLEDLWAFNEEAVTRAIAASAIPVVTGIGHEVDVSIADLVADHHAHTPTEAAQTIVARWRNAAQTIATSQTRLTRSLSNAVQSAAQRLNHVRRHAFFRRPLDPIHAYRQQLDEHQKSLAGAVNNRLRQWRHELNEAAHRISLHSPHANAGVLRQRLVDLQQRLAYSASVDGQRRLSRINALERELAAVSPDAVLRRGFSITTIKKGGAVVKTVTQIKGGETLITRVGDGQIESTADDPGQPKLF